MLGAAVMAYEMGMATAHRTDHPHFLLATDLDPAATPQVMFAARFSDGLGARTTLFYALLPPPLAVDAGAGPGAVPHTNDSPAARKRLKALADQVGATLPIHIAVEDASNARAAILSAADRIDADMILLPTHGRTGLERALLGSTAEQVVRRSKRPVLLVTDRMLREQPRAPDERGPVVVATDLSPIAVTAHRPAAELARRLGLPLLFTSVLPAREPPPYGGGAPVAPPPSDPQARMRERAAELRRHAVNTGVDVVPEVLACIDDDVAGALVATAAKQRAALLVLATHGRRGIARMLQGSVAEQVVRRATVPVLCMPAPEAED